MKQIFLIFTLTMIIGCSESSSLEVKKTHLSPELQANELFVQASLSARNMIASSTNYTDMFNEHKKITLQLNSILSDFHSTEMAVNLLSGQAKIIGYTLDEFNAKREHLAFLSSAEQVPLLSAVLLSEYGVAPQDRSLLYRITVDTFLNSGNNEKALIYLSRMEESTSLVNDSYFKSYYYTALAERYEKLNKPLKETQMCDLALKALLHGEESIFSGQYERIATIHSQAGRLDSALEVAKKAYEVKGASEKNSVMVSIGKVMTKSGDIQSAETILSGLKKTNKLNLKIIELQLEIGFALNIQDRKKSQQYIDEVFKFIKRKNSDYLTRDVIGTLLENNDFTNAKSLAYTIIDDYQRENTLISIADNLIRNNNKKEALRLLNNKLEIQESDFKKDNLYSISKIASLLFKAGDKNTAETIFNKIETLDIEGHTSYLLEERVKHLVSSGMINKAEELIERALNSVLIKIERGENPNKQLAILTSSYIIIGEVEKSMEIASLINDNFELARALIEISSVKEILPNHASPVLNSKLQVIVNTLVPISESWKKTI